MSLDTPSLVLFAALRRGDYGSPGRRVSKGGGTPGLGSHVHCVPHAMDCDGDVVPRGSLRLPAVNCTELSTGLYKNKPYLAVGVLT